MTRRGRITRCGNRGVRTRARRERLEQSVQATGESRAHEASRRSRSQGVRDCVEGAAAAPRPVREAHKSRQERKRRPSPQWRASSRGLFGAIAAGARAPCPRDTAYPWSDDGIWRSAPNRSGAPEARSHERESTASGFGDATQSAALRTPEPGQSLCRASAPARNSMSVGTSPQWETYPKTDEATVRPTRASNHKER